MLRRGEQGGVTRKERVRKRRAVALSHDRIWIKTELMPTYVAMLRGINVGSRKIVKMERLRASFAALSKRSTSNGALDNLLHDC